jgi:hypothetical protein
VEIGSGSALRQAVGCVSVDGSREKAKRGGRGLLAGSRGSFPPASEREARMDDPTLRCENDAGNETRLSGLPIPSGGPIFLRCKFSVLSFKSNNKRRNFRGSPRL